MQNKKLEERLKRYTGELAPVVPFAEGDKLLLMDFTAANAELTDEVISDTNKFIQYINKKLSDAGAKYGIGGYGEDRTIYRRSSVFGSGPTRLPEGEETQAQPTPADDFTKEVMALQSGPHSETPTASSATGRSGGAFGYQWADPSLYGMLQAYALKNRAAPTQAEEILWKAIQNKKIGSYKFRRQFIIDKYIADLVCLDRKLIIEIDGSIHQLPENIANDEIRTIALTKKEFSVIRFTNNDVLKTLEPTLEKIMTALSSRPSQKEGSKLSSPFGGQGATRSLHLGTDIWGPPHTAVMAPLNGIVHSFAFNNAYGDYGATIILTHNLDGETFHTLYGHLSLASIKNLHEGDTIYKGDVIAGFGIPAENGQWPPHLHFQIIKDMEGAKGDYPGVCAASEREKYLANCPDADLILGMMAKS